MQSTVNVVFWVRLAFMKRLTYRRVWSLSRIHLRYSRQSQLKMLSKTWYRLFSLNNSLSLFTFLILVYRLVPTGNYLSTVTIGLWLTDYMIILLFDVLTIGNGHKRFAVGRVRNFCTDFNIHRANLFTVPIGGYESSCSTQEKSFRKLNLAALPFMGPRLED